MTATGFEGFEKRLELHFSGDDPLGLRRLLGLDALQRVLGAVQCSIVSAVGNRHLDAYVLSESSLFVYPNRVIIKTCGTTQLLQSVPCLLDLAEELDLHLRACRYTRGNFIFPDAQPFPHSSFGEEVLYLERHLPGTLRHRKACVLPSKTSHSWHVYAASEREDAAEEVPKPQPTAAAASTFTVEVCMTELDRALARRFFRRRAEGSCGDVAGKEMTASTGIGEINPRALVCDFAFDPCGYSMNGLDGDRYSTIHVTPEDGHSYASFECVAGGGCAEVGEVLRDVARVFRPGTMSVSLCGPAAGLQQGDRAWPLVADALKPLGFKRRGRASEDIPGAATVVYQTFTARRK
uniref:S-adenosylmethionine decarboxylase proenzyme n=1 Tax=Anthurium amnicola TaxID=1678845 RepID=A0A1D1YNW3_9ARAE